MEKSSRKGAVCVFDSGIGGLSLLNECVRRLPYYDFIYFADNFNVPYGNRPIDEILALTDCKFSLINRLNPAAAVIACNTVTAECATFLRKKYAFPIIGIQPAIKPAAEAGGRCIVLATQATAASKPIRSLAEKCGVEQNSIVACPQLAEYIENHIFSIDEQEVINLLPNIEADSIVLGCTHYLFVSKIIARYYKCTIYDGNIGTANRLCNILGIFDHRQNESKNSGKVCFFGGNMEKNRQIFQLLRSRVVCNNS